MTKSLKKVLAIVLSVMMIFAVLPFASFAKVSKNDTAIDTLLKGEYFHQTYLAQKNNFKSELATYTAIGGYDKWESLATGKNKVDAAEAILLALIEKVEVNYDNEEFETIIKVLEGANTVAGVVEKVDKATGGAIGVIENSAWADSIAILKTAIRAANYANELYETVVDAYATILSAQAAATYFGDLLDYIAEKSDNAAIVKAAASVKEKATSSLEDACKKLALQVAEGIASDGVEFGINIALDSFTITAAIKTAYNTVSNIVDKVFNTSKKYEFMTALVILNDIEKIVPAYVEGVLAESDDDDAVDFAVNAILTLRETGESMTLNLGKVYDEAIVGSLYTIATGKLLAKTVKEESAKGAAILAVLRELVESDELYVTFAPKAVVSTSSDVTVLNGSGDVVTTIAANTPDHKIDITGAYVTTYNNIIDGTISVVVPFVAGYSIRATEVENPTTEAGGSTKPVKTESGNFFTRLIEAIKAFFANLFGGLKK